MLSGIYMPTAFLGLERIGPWEAILVLLVVLLLFGAKRLPDLARSLGRGLSEFKKGRAEGERKPEEPKDPPEDTRNGSAS